MNALFFKIDGKTAKMYRGGKICMTDHFKPLWARNVGKFGISHAMALGVIYNFYAFNQFNQQYCLTGSMFCFLVRTMVGC
jgi:hypothetical protein